jgi:EmrB/QacA subfamily drug resistance transporter
MQKMNPFFMEIEMNNQEHDHRGKPVNKNTVLFITTLGAFLTPFMLSSIIVAIPSIGKEFSASAVSLGWVLTAYVLATSVFLIPFGRLADIYGRKKVFTLGFIIYTSASFLPVFCHTIEMLIVIRAIQGIGGAMVFGNGVAIITSVFPAGERGRVLGINNASIYLGLSTGPFLGGLLTEYFGWRGIFIANVLLGLIIIASIFMKLKGEWTEAKGEKFDLIGSAIYGLALIVAIYGLTLLPAVHGLWLILIGVGGIVLFVWWEGRTRTPIFNPSIFKGNTVFIFSNLSTLINFSATYAVNFLLSMYLQSIRGLSPQMAGLILMTLPALQTVLSPMIGRLADRINQQILAAVGMALTTAGMGLLLFLNQNTSLFFVIFVLSILGLGFTFFFSPNMLAVMGSVERKHYGVASATVVTMRQIGMTLSMAITTLISALYLGGVEVTPEYFSLFLMSLKTSFGVFAALSFCAIFASLAGVKIRKKQSVTRESGSTEK